MYVYWQHMLHIRSDTFTVRLWSSCTDTAVSLCGTIRVATVSGSAGAGGRDAGGMNTDSHQLACLGTRGGIQTPRQTRLQARRTIPWCTPRCSAGAMQRRRSLPTLRTLLCTPGGLVAANVWHRLSPGTTSPAPPSTHTIRRCRWQHRSLHTRCSRSCRYHKTLHRTAQTCMPQQSCPRKPRTPRFALGGRWLRSRSMRRCRHRNDCCCTQLPHTHLLCSLYTWCNCHLQRRRKNLRMRCDCHGSVRWQRSVPRASDWYCRPRPSPPR